MILHYIRAQIFITTPQTDTPTEHHQNQGINIDIILPVNAPGLDIKGYVDLNPLAVRRQEMRKEKQIHSFAFSHLSLSLEMILCYETQAQIRMYECSRIHNWNRLK